MNATLPFNDVVSRDFHIVRSIDTLIIDQLIGEKRDKVHPVATTLAGFIDDRIGTGEHTHQTWVSTNDMGEVTAALYTARFDEPIINEHDLCGDAGGILKAKPKKAKTSDKPSFIFYSVSSFERGAGVKLIESVRGELEESSLEIWGATLSPLRVGGKAPAEDRNFTDWLKSQVTVNIDDIRPDTERLKNFALQYLSENRNPVQKFHMGNGAYIGDVNLDANVKGSADYKDGMNVMVNYVYPGNERRLELQSAYAGGEMTMAPHLMQTAGRVQNATVFKQFTP